MTDNGKTLAIAIVIAETAELDGKAAAERAATDKAAFRDATKRVISHQTAEAIAASEFARRHAGDVHKAADKKAAIDACGIISEAATDTSVRAGNVLTIALLDPDAYFVHVAQVHEAEAIATDALADAVSTLDPQAAREWLANEIAFRPASASRH